MLDSQIEKLWQESLNIAISKELVESRDPVKIFAEHIVEYLINQIEDPISKDEIRKVCGLSIREGVVVSTVTGKSFKVKDAMILAGECLTREEWKDYDNSHSDQKRLIAKEKGTPLEQLIQLDNLLR